MNTAVRALLAATLLVAGVVGCNNDSLPPAAGYANFSGTIVDSANQPVAGAIVTVDTVLTATTDAAGKFVIEKVPSGIVDYTVQAKGYKVVSSSAEVEPGKPFELNVTLATDSSPPH